MGISWSWLKRKLTTHKTDVLEILDPVVTNGSITNVKLAALARGSIKVGGAANAVTDLVAKDSGKILIGNGTDLNSVAVSGDVLLGTTGAVTLVNDTNWTMCVMGVLGIDNDGAMTNGGGLHGGSGVVLTEAAAAFAVVYNHDDTSFESLATSATNDGYTANYQLLPDVPAVHDAVYFGAATPFAEIAFDMGTAQTYDEAGVIGWQYFNGTEWATLTIQYNGTGSTGATGDYFGERDGALSFIPPADWDVETIDGQEAYWVRAVVQAEKADNITQVGILNSKEHYVVKVSDGFLVPHAGVITAVRLNDFAGTLHSANDVKFVLLNQTTGANTGALTFAQDLATDYWASLSLAVAKNDVLAVLVTQEDGANEVTNAVLELRVTLS